MTAIHLAVLLPLKKRRLYCPLTVRHVELRPRAPLKQLLAPVLFLLLAPVLLLLLAPVLLLLLATVVLLLLATVLLLKQHRL